MDWITELSVSGGATLGGAISEGGTQIWPPNSHSYSYYTSYRSYKDYLTKSSQGESLKYPPASNKAFIEMMGICRRPLLSNQEQLDHHERAHSMQTTALNQRFELIGGIHYHNPRSEIQIEMSKWYSHKMKKRPGVKEGDMAMLDSQHI